MSIDEVSEDFFDLYFDYIGHGEAPMIYHRWAAISMIGALLCRQYYLPFGHNYIYPNQYIMLIGPPAARKGSAMRPAKKLIQEAGFYHFGANRTSAERFIIDLQRSTLFQGVDNFSIEELENINLNEPSQLYIIAEEFADFMGVKNMNFINLLTNLWDNLDRYEHPKIHGSSVIIVKPTVNLFCGTNPVSLVDTVPPEAIGQGFTSRYIVIYSNGTGKLITWPDRPEKVKIDYLVEKLRRIQKNVKGPATILPETDILLNKIYHTYKGVDDSRFQFYNGRRFTHLLKLCLSLSAMRESTELTPTDAIRANTILDAAEQVMPRALGELGRSRFSEVSNNVLEVCHKENIGFRELWRRVAHDLDKEAELHQILKNLLTANKLQIVVIKGKQCFKRNLVEHDTWENGLIDLKYLTEEERR